MNDEDLKFTELELDALGEVMNISFGAAAADLAEVMDIFIRLNIPYIKTIEVSALPSYIRDEINDFENCSVIEQRYHGDFNGVALLIFPFGCEKELVSYFQQPENISYESDEIIELEREVLMEIGNILIGACIGKLFELIKSSITYFPPNVILGKDLENSFIHSYLDDDDFSITLKTNSFIRSCKSVLKFGNFVFFSQKLHKYLFPFKLIGSYSTSFEMMQQSCSMTPLRDEEGLITNIIITVQNVTEKVFLEKSLKAMVLEDGLTGIHNRRYLDKRLEEEFFRFKRNGRSLSLIMLDIDNFKHINDTYGHPFGDTVLKELAKTCKSITRGSDILARFGGEEFCFILPESETKGASVFGERLRRAIADLRIKYEESNKEISLTVSIGISVLDSSTESCEILLKKADAALYYSKNHGKNMVKVYSKYCDPENQLEK